jgi:methionyl-tRNA formyltransferase
MVKNLKDLKVVYMGTPNFSVPTLEMLIEETNVIGVVTQEDKEVGRKRVLTPSPVKECALKHNIKVLTPHKIREEYQDIIDLDPDIIITCAYGQIVPKELLDFPYYGCINIHGSILPEYRGASPIQSAIMNGDTETGITIMYMDEQMDTGNIINMDKIDIDITDTYGTLSDKLSIVGKNLLLKTLPKIIADDNWNIKQDDGAATYTKKITREQERLDFSKTKKEVYDYIRALNPSPLANILLNGEEIKIVEARLGADKTGEIGVITTVNKDSFSIQCSDGLIDITMIKRAGKNIMDVKSFLNGYNKDNLINKKVNNEE